MPLLFEQSAQRIHPNDDIPGAVLLSLLLGPDAVKTVGDPPQAAQVSDSATRASTELTVRLRPSPASTSGSALATLGSSLSCRAITVIDLQIDVYNRFARAITMLRSAVASNWVPQTPLSQVEEMADMYVLESLTVTPRSANEPICATFGPCSQKRDRSRRCIGSSLHRRLALSRACNGKQPRARLLT